MSDVLTEQGASLSLPSQRADRFDLEVAEAVQQVRKSTLTFAPEAGAERLRAVINKNLTEKEILNAVTSAYEAGWNKVKLYFMIGLPTETDIDLLAIVRLVQKMQAACKEIKRDKSLSVKDHLDVNVTFSNFVPKPHTPFQWFPQDSMPELNRKRNFLKENFRGVKGVKLNFTDPEISKLECCISKGDDRMANVIEAAYKKGEYLSAWDENLLFAKWFEALADEGIDPDEFASNAYTKLDEPLPWDNIHMGIDHDWLKSEYHKSLEEANSDPCFIGCNACGVCPEFSVQPVFIRPIDVANRPKKETPTLTKAERYPPPIATARLTIQKIGALRFISHLDWLRMLHRTLQRAHVPIAYSQGFNPSPKVSFGPALSMFVEGHHEFVDLSLTKDIPNLVEQLNAQLPEGGKILDCKWLPPHPLSLDRSVQYFIYSGRRAFATASSEYNTRDRIHALLDLPTWDVTIEKRGRDQKLDIKPFIRQIQLAGEHELIFTVLYPQDGLKVRPEWFLRLVDATETWQLSRLKVGLDSIPESTPLLQPEAAIAST